MLFINIRQQSELSPEMCKCAVNEAVTKFLTDFRTFGILSILELNWVVCLSFWIPVTVLL